MSRVKAIIVVVLLVGIAGAGAIYGINRFYVKAIHEQTKSALSNADQDVLGRLKISAFKSIQVLSAKSRDEELTGPLTRLPSVPGDASEEDIKRALGDSSATLAKKLRTVNKKKQFDQLMAISSDGHVVARIPGEDKFGDSVKGLPAVSECLSGIHRDGFYELKQSIHQVAVAPLMSSSGRVAGCLMGTMEMNSASLRPFAQVSEFDAALFVGGKLKVSTVDPAIVGPLANRLDSGDIIRFGKLKDAPMLCLQKDAYAARIVGVPGGTEKMHLAIILPQAPMLEPLQKAHETLFMGIGAVLVFGILLGLLLSGNKTDKQLSRLEDSVKLIAEGSSTSIDADNYSGAVARLAMDISQIINSHGRAGPASAAAPPGFMATPEPSAPQEPEFSPPPEQEPAQKPSTLDFESLLGSDDAAEQPEPPPPEPEAPPSVPAVPPPQAAESSAPPSASDPGMAVPPANPPPEVPPPSRAPDSAPPGGPRVNVPGELAGIFEEQEETREAEPFIPEQARPQPPPPPEPPAEEKPEFVAPSVPPAPVPSPEAESGGMDFDEAPDLDGASEEQVTSSDYKPDATVIAQVPNELLSSLAHDDSGKEAEAKPASVPPPPPTSLPKPPVAPSSSPPPKPAPDSSSATDTENHFKEVFEQFVKTKKECGEAIAGLSFDRFAEKLRKNTENLKTRYKCRSVKFQVYVKNGKAALRATPIK